MVMDGWDSCDLLHFHHFFDMVVSSLMHLQDPEAGPSRIQSGSNKAPCAGLDPVAAALEHRGVGWERPNKRMKQYKAGSHPLVFAREGG